MDKNNLIIDDSELFKFGHYNLVALSADSIGFVVAVLFARELCGGTRLAEDAAAVSAVVLSVEPGKLAFAVGVEAAHAYVRFLKFFLVLFLEISVLEKF